MTARRLLPKSVQRRIWRAVWWVLGAMAVGLASAGEVPWQLSLLYQSDGTLELVEAQPLPPTRKALQSPAARGAFAEIGIELQWRDAAGVVLATTPATLPLGTRVPADASRAESGLFPAEEIRVLRVPGPASDMGATEVVISRAPGNGVGLGEGRPRLRSPQHLSLAPRAEARALAAVATGPIGVTKIQDTGPDSNRLVLVVVGDGYLEEDLADGTYANHVAALLETFREDSPWDEMMAVTNVYQIDVVSLERGADYEDGPAGTGTLKDTYFDTAFWSSGIERLLTAPARSQLSAIVAANERVGIGVWDQIIMVVNSDKYGGSGGSIAINSVNPSGPEISVHEVGHSFAGLADEYVTYTNQSYNEGPPIEPNVDTRATAPKWAAWIEASTPLPTPDTSRYATVVGAFEGARYYGRGIYRPWRDCTMRSLGAGFCPVCREQHLHALFGLVALTDTVAPSTAEAVTVAPEATLAVTPLPYPDLSYTWSLDGSPLPEETGAALTLSSAQLATFESEAELQVRYASDKIRGEAPAETYRWTIRNAGQTARGTPHWWLVAHGFGVSGEADAIDHDGDRQSTHAEYLADTDPWDAASSLRFSRREVADQALQVAWSTSADRTYALEESSDLATWVPVPGFERIAGTGGTVEFTLPLPSTVKKSFRLVASLPAD